MTPLTWAPEAVRQVIGIAHGDQRTAERIEKAVAQYARDGVGDVQKLAGPGEEWRLRVGDWRVRFVHEAPPRRIHVLRVLNRRDAYD